MTEPKQDFLNRYNRQFYVIGERAMNKMTKSNVFLSGLGGLGLEIAKNVTLAGVHKITLHDPAVASYTDLSTQYFLSEKDIGKNRASITKSRIQELNPYVQVDVSSDDLNGPLEFLSQYQCVVLTEVPLSVQIKINEFCHSKDICFVSADCFGLFCRGFCDFGNNFEIHDRNGEEAKDVFLSDISRHEDKTVATCLEHHMHGFEDNDLVKFTELEGLSELNFDPKRNNTYRIKVITPYKFSIDVDISGLPKYEAGGIATQIKEIVVENYVTLKDSLEKPEIIQTDFSKFDHPIQIHLGFQALDRFKEKHGSLPGPWNLTHARELVEIASSINESSTNKLEKINEKLIKQLSCTAQGQVIGISGFLGGTMAQEVIKACSGKFTPLKQFLYLDVTEILPDPDDTKLDLSDYIPSGNPTRYDAQNICIGKSVTKKLFDTKLFMVGSGAIGCEMLKNYAMLGVSSGKGKITITDNDIIETSNLNRQFLFREDDITQLKSVTAAKAALRMNPSINVDAQPDKVGSETESKYSDTFFASLDIIVNALDNVQARLYVDSRCVTNQKPLLESGTMGTKSHVQVILPFRTETYASQRDPPEHDVPFCTIRSFPSRIEHTIEWARDKFQNMFISKPREVQQYFEDPSYLEALKSGAGRPKLNLLKYVQKIVQNPPKSWRDCVAFARVKFESYFNIAPQQILHAYPADMRMKDGTKFWALPKRPPVPLIWDSNNEDHRNFILSTASIYAHIYNVTPKNDLFEIAEICSKVELPKFRPKNKTIIIDESKTKEDVVKEEAQMDLPEQEFNAIINSLITRSTNKFKLQIEDFEKDDDRNFHVDFITAASNLRAVSYGISTADKLKTKQIAGKIIPAIATTTAAVSGLVSIELVKVLMGELPLDVYKNAFMNLALPFFSLSEPAKAEQIKITGNSFYTVWDRWELKGDRTLKDFIEYFKKTYDLTVTGVFVEVRMIYMAIIPMHNRRLPQKLSALIKPQEPYVDLIVSFDSSTGESVNGPIVRFWF